MISLGANSVGIGIAIKLHNQFSAQARQISGEFNHLYGNAQRALKQNLVAARRLGVGMVIAGTAGTLGFANATMAAAELNHTLKAVQTVTRVTGDQLRTLHDQSIAIGMRSKFTAQEIANAAEHLAKAGFEFPDIRNSLDAVADLGAAADIAVSGKEGAAGIMANILNTFGLQAKAAARVADVIAISSLKSSIDVLDFAESVKYAGSTATTLKVPLEDLSAMIAVLGNAGMRGSMAGVGLANMMMYLSKAVGKFRTKRQADALSMLGIHPDQLLDAQGNLKPMLQIVDIFARKLSKLPRPQQVSILEGLMNIRGARAMVPLMRQTQLGMTLPEMLRAIRDESAGAAQEMANMRMDTLKGDIMILHDVWNAFKVSIGETLEPIVRFGVKLTTKILKGLITFANTPLGKPLVVLAAGMSVALLVGGSLIVAISSLKLLTIASTVSFTNMGKSLVWAWSSGTAAAMRYAAAAQGATLVSTPRGMRWRGPNGRFIGGLGTGVTGLGSTGVLKGLFKTFLSGLGRVSAGLGTVGKGLGIIGAALTIAYGFKNVIKMVIYGLGTLAQAVMFVVDLVVKTFTHGPIDAFNIAMHDFKKRNEAFRKSFFKLEESPMNALTPKPKTTGFENTVGLKERLEELTKMRREKFGETKGTVIMDGKKVGEAIFQNQMDSLKKILEVKN